MFWFQKEEVEEDEEVTHIRHHRCQTVDIMPVILEVEEDASSEEDVEDFEVKKYVTSKVTLNLTPFVQHTQ